ncbi:DMT family transporter [Zeaxanthinibacter enoshimensis]|uniref:EamA-like transporter family protein n=1 Tax=Zeaxanthinibacter enoshimensis TaxID=392009 RepID=A0A4R6TKY9_9FLAO|nr:DMT family transporter [Zeaxanthinibacter enoshimensis]TDQ31644.1 EamA-like transporter family protein [Zeaxanthinibacter enoshimensis]
MVDLAFSILSSSLIFVIFKLYSIYRVHTLYAIVFNYITAATVGVFFFKGTPDFAAVPSTPWFPVALGLGLMFIIVFNLMATTSQKLGVSVASVATKMSLAIPVMAGVILYKEELGPLKILGIILALAAVYFASVKKKKITVQKDSLLWPMLVFLGSGIIDTTIKYLEERLVTTEEFPLFTTSLFAAAGSVGLIILAIHALQGRLELSWRAVAGGIVLGVPNYFSIFFLLRALQSETLNSASIFTINNVAIVMFSTLLGIVLFKEKISPRNWGGIALAVVSILLVALF